MKNNIKSQASMMNMLIAVILISLTFLTLFLIFGPPLADFSKKSETMACKAQLGLAANNALARFSSCHTYRLEFGEKSVIKYDMFLGDKKVEEYKYSSALNDLKKKSSYFEDLNIKDKTGAISEDIIYFIIAEEMIKCHELYYVPQLNISRTIKLGYEHCSNQNFCQPCSLIHFNEDNFPKPESSSLTKFKPFLKAVSFSKTEQKSYYDFLYETYITNVVSLDSQDVITEDNYATFLKDQTEHIFNDKSLIINMDESYLIEYVYRPNLFKSGMIGVTSKTATINPYIIDFIKQDEESLFCDYYLTMIPDGGMDTCFS